MPIVSVIIPAYGHAEYILLTLDSVFAQSFLDYEVIVVNDGSPDRTAEVLAPLIEAGKIRYFEQANQGVAASRNFGISKANGTYIALLDDDDLWPPDKLEWQVAILEESGAVAVGGSAVVIGPEGESKQIATEGGMNELSLERFFEGNPFFSPGQVLFQRAASERGVRFDPSIWGVDDLDFWVSLVQEGRFMRSDRMALYYRVHGTNASHNRLKMLVNSRKLLTKCSATLETPQRERCLAAGYRWIFGYLGRDMLWEARFSLLSRHPRIVHGCCLSYTLLKTFAGSFRDAPETFEDIKKELKSAFVTSVWHALKQRIAISS